jgi:hypothetical protein
MKFIDIYFSIQLKPEVYTTASKENPPRVFNFLESLSNRISFEDKHPDAKSYVHLIDFFD